LLLIHYFINFTKLPARWHKWLDVCFCRRW